MPCSDGYAPSYGYREDPETRRRLDLATRVACKALGRLTNQQLQSLDDEVLDWWKKHQADDARRLAREKAARDHARLKRNAINKLTAEERKALNL